MSSAGASVSDGPYQVRCRPLTNAGRACGQASGPSSGPQARPAFVSGRHLTWYGPSLIEAPALLTRQLQGAD